MSHVCRNADAEPEKNMTFGASMLAYNRSSKTTAMSAWTRYISGTVKCQRCIFMKYPFCNHEFIVSLLHGIRCRRKWLIHPVAQVALWFMIQFHGGWTVQENAVHTVKNHTQPPPLEEGVINDAWLTGDMLSYDLPQPRPWCYPVNTLATVVKLTRAPLGGGAF